MAMNGKVALVTGGGSGLGEACVHALAARGATVVVADISKDAAERVAGAVGNGAAAVTADVSDEADVRSMVERIVGDHGRLDVAVNNAGIGGDQLPTGEYPVESWRKVLSVNLDGVFYCMRHELPAMVAGGGGAIVNMASILGSVGFAQSCAYVAAKHGVVGLTRTAAIEYARQSIRVNAVGPGFIETPLLAAASQEIVAGVAGLHPVGRLGRPEEVAALVAFLASDGGYTAQ
jgi:NAD(P)-dependent dehydrogenase (short-subunit alcohol dehydrogenase family)